MERAAILSVDGIIHDYHLPPNLQKNESNAASQGALTLMVSGMANEIILEALKRSHGNMAWAARDLGITERMTGLGVAKCRINPGEYK